MKKIVTMLLALVMLLALAACGETKEADVVENVDPQNNSVVIETPPAIVSGQDTPPVYYPDASGLPVATPGPTENPFPVATSVPLPINTPTASGTELPSEGNPPVAVQTVPPFEYADDSGDDYNPTATDEEKNGASTAYINGDWVNFRVGPGTNYKIYESLPKGTEVKVLGHEGGWAKIWYNNYLIGYVDSSFLTTTPPQKGTSSVTPAPSGDSSTDAVIITP